MCSLIHVYVPKGEFSIYLLVRLMYALRIRHYWGGRVLDGGGKGTRGGNQKRFLKLFSSSNRTSSSSCLYNIIVVTGSRIYSRRSSIAI